MLVEESGEFHQKHPVIGSASVPGVHRCHGLLMVERSSPEMSAAKTHESGGKQHEAPVEPGDKVGLVAGRTQWSAAIKR